MRDKFFKCNFKLIYNQAFSLSNIYSWSSCQKILFFSVQCIIKIQIKTKQDSTSNLLNNVKIDYWNFQSYNITTIIHLLDAWYFLFKLLYTESN